MIKENYKLSNSIFNDDDVSIAMAMITAVTINNMGITIIISSRIILVSVLQSVQTASLRRSLSVLHLW